MWFMDFVRSLTAPRTRVPLRFYNTLTKSKDVFTLPPVAKQVRMYNCGPTVYGVQHIGNLSMFVFTDTLRRTLEYNGFAVKQVINITDVGHLSSDADAGEDKMTLGLKREKMRLTLANMRALAGKYADIFVADLQQLNIDTSKIQFPRASDHIPAQIAMTKTLEEKGYAYKTADGVYFDTSKFPRYGELGGIDIEGLKEGARVAMVAGKRNPTDFALWKIAPQGTTATGRKKPVLGWDSPWGKGFPGWHIECSAMARVCLGEKIDIHTGGVEHIPIHHNNEIAQSECATGKRPFSRFWMHRAHIQIDGGKIAKSQGNVVYLSEIIDRGFHPLALRYLFLGAHYRTSANFSWEALQAAQNAYARLLSLADKTSSSESGLASPRWLAAFCARINDDLDTPGALAILWEMTKDDSLQPADLHSTLIAMNRVLGLRLGEPDAQLAKLVRKEINVADLPGEVQALLTERETARSNKDWAKADELRQRIQLKGYDIKDGEGGVSVSARS